MKNIHGNCKKIQIWTRETKLFPSQYITTTDSVTEAAEVCGLTVEMVSLCLHGKRKSANYEFKESNR